MGDRSFDGWVKKGKEEVCFVPCKKGIRQVYNLPAEVFL